jgi:hypothetical protein
MAPEYMSPLPVITKTKASTLNRYCMPILSELGYGAKGSLSYAYKEEPGDTGFVEKGRFMPPTCPITTVGDCKVVEVSLDAQASRVKVQLLKGTYKDYFIEYMNVGDWKNYLVGTGLKKGEVIGTCAPYLPSVPFPALVINVYDAAGKGWDKGARHLLDPKKVSGVYIYGKGTTPTPTPTPTPKPKPKPKPVPVPKPKPAPAPIKTTPGLSASGAAIGLGLLGLLALIFSKR